MVALPTHGAPRSTLLSVDLEVLYRERPVRLRSTVPPPLPERAREGVRPLVAVRAAPVSPLEAAVASLDALSPLESPTEAASVALVAAMRIIPSLAGVAMLRDEERGEHVVVYARGPRAGEIVRHRVAPDDALVATARLLGGPTLIEYGESRAPAERHALLGDPWSVLVVPALDDGGCPAVLELADPIDAQLREVERSALRAIAERLAAFCRGKVMGFGRVFSPEQVGLED